MGQGNARRAAAVLVGAATLLLAVIVWPIWRPLVVAALLVGVSEPLYRRGLARFGRHRSLLTLLFTLAIVLLVLVPLAAIVVISTREILSAVTHVRAALTDGGIEGVLSQSPSWLLRLVHRLQHRMPGISNELRSHLAASGRWALGMLSGGLSVVASLAFELALMLIAYFFLLRDGAGLVDWLGRATPLPAPRVREFLREFQKTARSVLGANLATGAIQAAVATVGFLIAHAPSPILFALLTMVASLIPSIGTTLVTLPLAGLLLVLGHHWAALFLALWAVFIVGLIDNLVRPWLIRGQSHLDGALIFFSLIGAVGAFGAIGLLIGPLVLTFFIAALRVNRSVKQDWLREHP